MCIIIEFALWFMCILQAATTRLSLEDTGHGSITLKTYFKYFLMGSGYMLTIVMCILFLVSQVRILSNVYFTLLRHCMHIIVTPHYNNYSIIILYECGNILILHNPG